MSHNYDAVIIGGGFYGISIALLLKKYHEHVVVLEKEKDIMLRASFVNQARVHGGYHYPRSVLTAQRASTNIRRFVADFSECIEDTDKKFYAIARHGSKIDAAHFWKFSRYIGAPVRKASKTERALFNDEFVEDVFSVEEEIFNVDTLRQLLKRKIVQSGLKLICSQSVQEIQQGEKEMLEVVLGNGERMVAGRVFNCTYSNINQILKKSEPDPIPLKNEFTEMAMIRVPAELTDVCVTIMDGPFFSVMPFPAKGLHALSHVRYTPHFSWDHTSQPQIDQQKSIVSRYIYMMKDAQRYMPVLKNAEYVDSLYEIKAVLPRNEIDDGRPILFQESRIYKNFFTVLGAKIDNIYDILDTMEARADLLD